MATSSGGTGILQSNFSVFDGVTLTTLKDYTTQGYVIWTPTKAGTYVVSAKVKDEVGNIATKTLIYQVN